MGALLPRPQRVLCRQRAITSTAPLARLPRDFNVAPHTSRNEQLALKI